MAMAEEDTFEVERCIYDWPILSFNELFKELKPVKSKNATDKQRCYSELEILSEEFILGQHVGRPSIWQLQLRRAGLELCASLSCLHCFRENIEGIWTRFDVDVVNFDGKVCHTASGGAHFDSVNITKFTPKDKCEDKKNARANEKSNIWETRVIGMHELSQNWDKLVTRNAIVLRLRLYIYREKPFNEASYMAQYKEPVKLCYTDHSQNPHNSPFMKALASLWESMENHDIEFLVDEQSIKAHKFVVSLQSAWMKNAINEMEKAHPPGQCKITIPDSKPAEFQFVLKYLYTGEAEGVKKLSTDAEFIGGVLKLCTKLGIDHLSRICMTRLMTDLNMDNFVNTAAIVYSSTAPGSFFRTELKRFLMENQRSLQKLKSFKVNAANKPDWFLQLCFEPIELNRNSA